MFKNMKLAAKMGMGFGLLVVIAAILGYVGWSGLSSVARNAELNHQGNECVQGLNECASLRREFAIRGFDPYGDDNKTAAEYWQEAYDTLLTELGSLEAARHITSSDKAIVAEAVAKMPAYLTSFDHQKTARQTRDQAFSRWGEVGWSVTDEVGSVVTDVIAPGRQAAQEAEDITEIERWTTIGGQLDESVFQEFLILRVTAVYLLATNKEAQWESYQKQLAKVKANAAAWADLVQGNAALEAAAERIVGYVRSYEEAGQQYRNGMLAQRDADTEMATAAADIVDTFEQLDVSLKSRMNRMIARTNTIMFSVAICGIVIGTTLAILITASIIKPIKRVIAALTSGSEQVAAASSQVSSASQSLAEGATEQAAGLEETSSSLEEMASMTKQNADNAQQANVLASEAREAASTGAESMSRMNAAIQDIQSSSDETAKIIKVIDEIAFQTNLLALNAAVEAARAGEAGKGFAVVAEEVRNLAMRSAEAAKNTSNMIEESVRNARNGVDIAAEVGRVLDEIVQSVGKTTDLVSEIAAASQEQAQGIDQVNTAIAQMDKVTQQNAANAEESASASEELSSQAEAMSDVVTDLVAIVGGAASHMRTSQSPPSHRKAGSHSNRGKGSAGIADASWHEIAEGHSAGGQKTTAASSATRHVIPLDADEEGFDAFNA